MFRRRLAVIARHLGDTSGQRRGCHTISVNTTSASGRMDVRIYAALSDNYGFLVHCKNTGATAAVDTPDAQALLKELKVTGWKLSHVLNTHHHADHVGGNMELVKVMGGSLEIYGPETESTKIPGVTRVVKHGEVVQIGDLKAKVMDVSGHTLDHVAYYFEKESTIFAGDAIFPLGAGRVFEGTFQQAFEALGRIAVLPDDTQIYSAHEYALSNAKFALTIDPENQHLIKRVAQFQKLREMKQPTVPTTVGLEKMTNPFLTLPTYSLGEKYSSASATPGQIYGEIRKRKDNFKA